MSAYQPLPLEFRVYGLEGGQATQDDAIVKQGLTLAMHDEQLRAHRDMQLLHGERLDHLCKATAALTAMMNKAIWAILGFCFTVASAAVIPTLT